MTQFEKWAMVFGILVGTLMPLSMWGTVENLKLAAVIATVAGAMAIYGSSKLTRAAFPSMQRNDWSISSVLRDAAAKELSPTGKLLVRAAEGLSAFSISLVGALLGTVVNIYIFSRMAST